MAAALLAGVGVAGLSAAGASAMPGHLDLAIKARTRVAAHTDLTPSTTDASSPTLPDSPASSASMSFAAPDSAGGAGIASAEPVEIPSIGSGLSFARSRRKVRPVPVVRWVNPLPEAAVTSCFGQRWGRLHAGVDLAAPNGTRIRAAGAGVVVAEGPAAGYGNAVLIDHGNGYLTHYGHMSAITVTAGQRVAAGEQIGNEGSTGHSTGPHLHFEVHQGSYKNPIEPTQWMHAHGVDIRGCVRFR
jgi:murein DD-endopeptidase MepM/ murein hydrolase activator NlpD